jgi:pimeloyl-ACP methyl ester carboxylesterase
VCIKAAAADASAVAYAAAIPGAQFRLLDHAGHMPQIEMPGALMDVIWPFVGDS